MPHCISRIDIALRYLRQLKLRTDQAFTRKRNYISRWKTYLIQGRQLRNGRHLGQQ